MTSLAPFLLLAACAPSSTATRFVFFDGLGAQEFAPNQAVLSFDLVADGPPILAHDGDEVSRVELPHDGAVALEGGLGLSDEAEVVEVTVFTSERGNKGALLGEWRRGQPDHQIDPALEVVSDHDGVWLFNTNTSDADRRFFFSVTVEDQGEFFDSDPELINKKKKLTQVHEADGAAEDASDEK